MSPNSGSSSYKLSYTIQVAEQIKAWQEEATARGIGQELLESMRFIHNQLEQDPLAWGESSHRLVHLDLVKCVGFHKRIQVTYGVHQTAKIVFIQRVQLLSGHPLFQEPEQST